MCIICKNEDTQRITGAELIPFEEYHQGDPFKAFECNACGHTTHFKTNDKKPT